MSSAPDTDAPEEPPAVDELRQSIVEALQRDLGDAIVGHEVAGGDLWVRVTKDAWRRAGEAAKRQGFDYFCFLSVIDWMPNPNLSGEKVWDPDAATEGDGDVPTERTTGVAGGDTRFQVFARLYDVRRFVGVTLKADAGDDGPEVDSWVPLFAGADWHEREAWEMYGVEFTGHPGLRHLYLPGEFEGFPGRKDFPLLAREVKPWPGLVDVEPIPGDDEPAEGEEAPAE